MTQRFLAATRKGVFTVERQAGRWAVVRAAFLGDHSPVVLHDPRDGALYAAMDHGHFGGKIQRSRDGGATWQECAAPAYPPQPEGQVDLDAFRRTPIPWKLQKIWALEAGNADEPGVLWCGTIPGGLFRSDDGGDSWRLVRPLWDDPKRKEWFGGGADLPGIHSVCVDPRDGRR